MVRIVAAMLALAGLTLPLGASAFASHSAEACGQVVEYVAPPSDDIAHGYGQLRLATSRGDPSLGFHHTNPTNTPSRTDQGATRQGANVCMSGPYVHVLGSTPYISPYVLRVATPSMPATSTADARPDQIAVIAGLVTLAMLAMRLRARRTARAQGD